LKGSTVGEEAGSVTVLEREQYLQHVLGSLFYDVLATTCGADEEGPAAKLAFSQLVSDFPLDAQIASVEVFCSFSGKHSSQGVIDLIEPESALNLASLMLRWASRKCPGQPSAVYGVIEVLGLLVSRALASGESSGGCSFSLVVDTLFLRKAGDARAAQVIVTCFPLVGLVELIDTVVSVWGEKMFVARGERKLQGYLTEALLSSLERTDSAMLMSSTERKIPIIISLSTGVSTYLDASDKRSRIFGMRVAKRFSAILGQEISFEELDDEKDGSPSSLTPALKGEVQPTGALESRGQNEDQKKNEHIEVVDVDEQSSDSELEAFELGEERVGEVPSTNYLRICLEMLQYSETKPDARDKQEVGLTSIPRILASKPADAPDVCALLMRELMRLSNTFNVQNFEESRNTAIHALLTMYPQYALPMATGAIESDGLMLGARISAINALIKAAHALANLPLPDASNTTTLGISTREEAAIDTASTSATLGGKTRIKRPLKLAASKRQVRFFRNNFGPYALQFYFPLLHTLSAQNKRSIDGAGAGGVGSSASAANITDLQDGVEALLSAQILSALGYFTKCSINTHHQRLLIENTIAVATSMRSSTSLGIRRASLFAIHCSISAWVLQRASWSSSIPSKKASGAFETLTDLAGTTSGASSGNITSAISDGELGRAVANTVDWALLNVKQEPDAQSRAFMVDIVRQAIMLDANAHDEVEE